MALLVVLALFPELAECREVRSYHHDKFLGGAKGPGAETNLLGHGGGYVGSYGYNDYSSYNNQYG